MQFQFTTLAIEGLILVEPKVYTDNRGYFLETYNHAAFTAAGISDLFVQDNESYSTAGVIRGIHYQRPPNAQAKLVRVVQGSIWDVAVDLREDSPTKGKWVGIELSAENKRQLYLPDWCAHGFYVQSETALVLYKVSKEYSPENEEGIAWDDPELAIDWPSKNPGLSARDQKWHSFSKAVQHFK